MRGNDMTRKLHNRTRNCLATICLIAVCGCGQSRLSREAAATPATPAAATQSTAATRLVTTLANKNPIESKTVDLSTLPSDWEGLLRTAGALVLVVGLLLAARWWLRRKQLAMTPGVGSIALGVLARATLAPRQELCLVRLGNRLVLIGVSGSTISRLSEITDADEVERLMDSAQSKPASTLSRLAGAKFTIGGMGKSE